MPTKNGLSQFFKGLKNFYFFIFYNYKKGSYFISVSKTWITKAAKSSCTVKKLTTRGKHLSQTITSYKAAFFSLTKDIDGHFCGFFPVHINAAASIYLNAALPKPL